MIKKIIFYFFAALLIGGCEWFTPSQTLVFTHSGNGYLDPCDCSESLSGGLARRQAVFQAIRDIDEHALFFDAGNFLSTYHRFQERDKYMIRLMSLMSYDAVGLGEQEFINGPAFARRYLWQLPLVTSNVVGFGTNAKVFNRLEEKVGVISLVHPDFISALDDSIYQNVEVISPTLVLPNLIAALKSQQIDNIVLLSQLGLETDKQMASDYPELSLIISGHDQVPGDSLWMVANTPIVQNGPSAERVGILEGYFVSGKFRIKHYNHIRLDDQVLPDSLFASESDRYRQSEEYLKTNSN